ncbi:MAG TPA: hypothetical protein VFA22_11045 [Stellaceae bacterium]|nr:hypothetical protein [Stellaceae bacterium]
MHATLRNLALLLPAAALLAACGSSQPEPAVATAPPPPPPPPAPVTGALVAPVLPAAPAYSGSSTAPVMVPGAMRLSASDALGLLSNNTAIGLTDAGMPYQVYFGNNGVARFHDRSMTDGGTWRVLPNGQVCSSMPHIAGGTENCYVLSRYGDVILYGPPNGPARGSIRVVAGNPQAL